MHGLFLLAVLLGLGSLAAHIPLAVLAGILIPIGFKIVDVKGLKHLRIIPKADGVVLILVLLMTTFGSLIQAVGLGVILASLLFMKRSSDLAEKGLEVGTLAGKDGEPLWPDEMDLYNTYKDKIYIKHLYGPLFFGFTAHFQDQIKLVSKDLKALVIRMDRVPHVDQSGLYALETAITDLQNEDVIVLLTGLTEQPKDMLMGIDIIPDLVPEERVFETIDGAYNYLKVQLKEKK